MPSKARKEFTTSRNGYHSHTKTPLLIFNRLFLDIILTHYVDNQCVAETISILTLRHPLGVTDRLLACPECSEIHS